MIKPEHDPLKAASNSFVITHCRNCAMAWTRTGTDGSMMTVCLLDRELVWSAMASCDRFEERGQE